LRCQFTGDADFRKAAQESSSAVDPAKALTQRSAVPAKGLRPQWPKPDSERAVTATLKRCATDESWDRESEIDSQRRRTGVSGLHFFG